MLSNLWAIDARIESRWSDVLGERSTSEGVPAFLLNGDVLGIVSAEHACKVARDILAKGRPYVHGGPDAVYHISARHWTGPDSIEWATSEAARDYASATL